MSTVDDPIPADAVTGSVVFSCSQVADVACLLCSFSLLSRVLADSSMQCSPQLLGMMSCTTPAFSPFLPEEPRAANELF